MPNLEDRVNRSFAENPYEEQQPLGRCKDGAPWAVGDAWYQEQQPFGRCKDGAPWAVGDAWYRRSSAAPLSGVSKRMRSRQRPQLCSCSKMSDALGTEVTPCLWSRCARRLGSSASSALSGSPRLNRACAVPCANNNPERGAQSCVRRA